MTTEEKNDIRARSTSIDDVLHDLQEKVDVVAVDKKNVVIGDDGRLLINGIELTENIRKAPEISYIPIIMCTGKNTPENLQYSTLKKN